MHREQVRGAVPGGAHDGARAVRGAACPARSPLLLRAGQMGREGADGRTELAKERTRCDDEPAVYSPERKRWPLA